jgi:hypothetical protein
METLDSGLSGEVCRNDCALDRLPIALLPLIRLFVRRRLRFVVTGLMSISSSSRSLAHAKASSSAPCRSVQETGWIAAVEERAVTLALASRGDAIVWAAAREIGMLHFVSKVTSQ